MTTFRALAIFAHPDDETFRPGGTLALLAAKGVRVWVLTATRGEAGSCGDPPRCAPEQLAAVRERELRRACATLGLEAPRLLGYHDGRLDEAHPGEVMAEIQAIVAEVAPSVLLSFGEDGLSGHPDHVAVGRWATEIFAQTPSVAALYGVSVPRRVAQALGLRGIRGVADETVALSVDVSEVWDVKRAAMECHATQWSTSPMRRTPAEARKDFFGREYFVRLASRQGQEDFMPRILREYLL